VLKFDSPLVRATVLLLAAGFASACVKAIRPPPTLADLAVVVAAPAEPPQGSPERLLAQAEQLFARRDPAQARLAAAAALQAAAQSPTSEEAVVSAARILVWLVDHEPDPKAREQIATQAVQAAQACPGGAAFVGGGASEVGGASEGGGNASGGAPAAPHCAYWLAAAVGVQARERPTTGLSALPLIESNFQAAARGDAAYDSGGPDRALALFYLRAPHWPTGPGDPDKGIEHAHRALKIDPSYPPNLLALSEALRATGDDAGAVAAARQALDGARKAGAMGDPDAAEWEKEAATSIKAGGGT
jgi:tetratricopeptide (TPR) repeat protein